MKTMGQPCMQPTLLNYINATLVFVTILEWRRFVTINVLDKIIGKPRLRFQIEKNWELLFTWWVEWNLFIICHILFFSLLVSSIFLLLIGIVVILRVWDIFGVKFVNLVLQLADLERELEEFEERRTQWEQELTQESQSRGRNLQLESKQVRQNLLILSASV